MWNAVICVFVCGVCVLCSGLEKHVCVSDAVFFVRARARVCVCVCVCVASLGDRSQVWTRSLLGHLCGFSEASHLPHRPS